MAQSLFTFKSDSEFVPFLRTPIITSYVISGLLLAGCIVYYFVAQPVLPLFYSLARPAQHIAPKVWLFTLPVISLIISILHSFLVQLFKEYSRVILKLFIWVTVVLQCILLLVFLRIVLITI